MFPIIIQEEVFHVGERPGTKGSTEKGRSSFEGNALSVSTHPDAWRRIARPLPGALWRLEGPGRFIDYHAFSEAGLVKVLRSRPDLVTPRKAWFVSSYDEGDEEYLAGPYSTRREAMEEAFDEEDLSQGIEWKPTAKLRSLSPGKDGATEALLVIAGEQGLDGVWWDDDLDPYAGSAPRGGLLRSRLREWDIEEA
jgi:hypothetical protein